MNEQERINELQAELKALSTVKGNKFVERYTTKFPMLKVSQHTNGSIFVIHLNKNHVCVARIQGDITKLDDPPYSHDVYFYGTPSVVSELEIECKSDMETFEKLIEVGLSIDFKAEKIIKRITGGV